METERPVALIDMDGTLCDYIGKLKKDLEALKAPGEETCIDLFDESKPWIKARMDLIKDQPGWWRNLAPLNEGMTIYNILFHLDFEIEILTKGPRTNRRAWMEKGEWVDFHLADDVPINVVGKDKKRYYGHVLVEDYPEYLSAWLEHRPRGLGIIIDNEYNRHFTHENVIRYDGSNLDMIVKHLQAVKARKQGEHWRDYL